MSRSIFINELYSRVKLDCPLPEGIGPDCESLIHLLEILADIAPWHVFKNTAEITARALDMATDKCLRNGYIFAMSCGDHMSAQSCLYVLQNKNYQWSSLPEPPDMKNYCLETTGCRLPMNPVVEPVPSHVRNEYQSGHFHSDCEATANGVFDDKIIQQNITGSKTNSCKCNSNITGKTIKEKEDSAEDEEDDCVSKTSSCNYFLRSQSKEYLFKKSPYLNATPDPSLQKKENPIKSNVNKRIDLTNVEPVNKKHTIETNLVYKKITNSKQASNSTKKKIKTPESKTVAAVKLPKLNSAKNQRKKTGNTKPKKVPSSKSPYCNK